MKAEQRRLLFVGVGVFVLLAAVQIFASFSASKQPTPLVTTSPLSAAETAQSALRAKVVRGPIKPREQAALESAMNDRFPRGSRVDSHTAFYFDGKATSCGDVRPHGSGRFRRYIYRNGSVVAEGDQSTADFEMFWQICTAGGRPS